MKLFSRHYEIPEDASMSEPCLSVSGLVRCNRFCEQAAAHVFQPLLRFICISYLDLVYFLVPLITQSGIMLKRDNDSSNLIEKIASCFILHLFGK